jgi:hypothetical protein
VTAADPASLAGVKLGNYRLGRILGRGNMGVVYLATDEALLRPTAVKVLAWSPSEIDPETWFLAEARSVARLNHPSVIQIYSVARHGPYCYIAMEYVEGVSADVMIQRGGVFSAERATEVMLQVIEALTLAHAADLIHRDIKPGNVLIRPDGMAKLGDFGMAVSAAARGPRAGTPHYFAPEIWRNEPASVASDLYAFGASYFYLLTGRPPFDVPTLGELSAAHLGHEVAIPAGMSDACAVVIRRCMAKLPGDRPASAREVGWELRGVLRALSTRPPRRATLDETGGFTREPFSDLDPAPYTGAPFDRVRAALAAALEPGATVVLAGAAGSGRSTLARAALAAHGEGIYVEFEPGRRTGLLQRIARAFGAVASPARPATGELEAVLDAIAAAPAAPLIVVDGIRAPAELALLARAARTTRSFTLLIIGARPDAHAIEIRVPPLAPGDVARYLTAWLLACQAPGAPPRIVSPDAGLVVGVRAEGNLARIHALARQMLATGGAVLTSWDAWAADDQSAGLRPRGWPTPSALALINTARADSGTPPRPELEDVPDAMSAEPGL